MTIAPQGGAAFVPDLIPPGSVICSQVFRPSCSMMGLLSRNHTTRFAPWGFLDTISDCEHDSEEIKVLTLC